MSFIRPIAISALVCFASSCVNESQRYVKVDPAAATVDSAVAGPSNTPSIQPPAKTVDFEWVYGKYSYVDPNAGVNGLITLGRDRVFTQVALVQSNGYKVSGHGTYDMTEDANGRRLIFKRESGVTFDGTATLQKDSSITVFILPTGARYIKDENGYYIKNQVSTLLSPRKEASDVDDDERAPGDDSISNTGNSTQRKWSGDRMPSERSEELVYEGNMNDERSGISQHYVLRIRPDLGSASIGDGPFNRLEDQGDGSYMWVDGTIIGMSIKPGKGSCVVYGSDGSYFCTLFRR